LSKFFGLFFANEWIGHQETNDGRAQCPYDETEVCGPEHAKKWDKNCRSRGKYNPKILRPVSQPYGTESSSLLRA
jgi:hypothetical protein